MRYRIFPYRQGSRSARKLSQALGGKVLKLQGSSFVPKTNDVIINWGNKDFTGGYWGAAKLLNVNINDATNKLKCFKLMKYHEVPIPLFWENPNDIPDNAFPIVCRTTLAGHSGDGIVIANNRQQLVPCPLYVQYIKKVEEYRVHVGQIHEDIRIIAVQRKARSTHVPDNQVNWQVRNLSNGFIYTRGGFTAPPSVVDAAKLALGAGGLDFGAVDVIWNEQKERAYVLEINTAPGLEGQTVEDYANFFRSL